MFTMISSTTDHPLSNYPEFSVIKYNGSYEYRVQNRHIINNPHNVVSLTFRPLALAVCMAVATKLLPTAYCYSLYIIILLLVLKQAFLNILHESVILLPPHGIQLETHRGIFGLRPLFSNRRFISSTSLENVIINEGLSGWNVLYYLAVVKRTRFEESAMDVAFQNLLPPHPILLKTFEGIHQFILSSPSQTTKSKRKAK